MTTAKDLALSVSLASYARDLSRPATVTITTQKLVKVERPKKGRPIAAAKPTAKPVESAEKPAAPSPNGKVAGVALPAAGTIGAKAFIMMMNRSKSRDEKIVAIASYIGYQTGGDFASQEMVATSQAKREISPVKVEGPTREEIRTAQRSVTGYVAGMPDALRRTVQDLIGREQLAVDARNDHVREARTKTLSWAERKLAIGLARLEQERLAVIRADLARYVG
jgi:hypothetical protein